MRVAALLCRLYVPFDDQWITLHRCPVQFGDRDAVGAQGCDFALVYDDDAACVFENGGYVRGKELLVLAQANDEWPTTATRTDQEIGLLSADHNDGIRACDTFQGEPYRPLKVVLAFAKVVLLNQV